jgi:DNA-binding HxlR family transcriptional regulator
MERLRRASGAIDASKGVLRVSELEAAIPGVTQKILIQQLRELARDDVVVRTIYAEVPHKVEYGLTAPGKDLCPGLDELLVWARQRKVLRERQAGTKKAAAKKTTRNDHV